MQLRPLKKFPLLVLVAALLAFLTAGVAPPASSAEVDAPQLRFLRIATGPTGGNYFPVGGLIASAISNPPGSRPCERGGSCGVPGLIAAAQSTHGSVSNVEALVKGGTELALAQADIAYWAYEGTGIFEDGKPLKDLRAVARLYPESIHLVARKGSGIESVKDLKGKRVSLGEQGSGTLVDATAILHAFGLKPSDVEAVYVKPGPSADALEKDALDAFFFVAGAPVGTIGNLIAEDVGSLVPIDGKPADALTAKYPFLTKGVIPAGAYPDTPEVETLRVGALLLTSADLPNDLIYKITKAIWHPSNRKLFTEGHAAAARIDPEEAASGIGIPLHPGAERYYLEAGLLTEPAASETNAETLQ